MPIIRAAVMSVLVLSTLVGCSRLLNIGQTPGFTEPTETREFNAMTHASHQFDMLPDEDALQHGSLWQDGPRSLLGDRRASRRGCLLYTSPSPRDS